MFLKRTALTETGVDDTIRLKKGICSCVCNHSSEKIYKREKNALLVVHKERALKRLWEWMNRLYTIAQLLQWESAEIPQLRHFDGERSVWYKDRHQGKRKKSRLLMDSLHSSKSVLSRHGTPGVTLMDSKKGFRVYLLFFFFSHERLGHAKFNNNLASRRSRENRLQIRRMSVNMNMRHSFL